MLILSRPAPVPMAKYFLISTVCLQPIRYTGPHSSESPKWIGFYLECRVEACNGQKEAGSTILVFFMNGQGPDHGAIIWCSHRVLDQKWGNLDSNWHSYRMLTFQVVG